MEKEKIKKKEKPRNYSSLIFMRIPPQENLFYIYLDCSCLANCFFHLSFIEVGQ